LAPTVRVEVILLPRGNQEPHKQVEMQRVKA